MAFFTGRSSWTWMNGADDGLPPSIGSKGARLPPSPSHAPLTSIQHKRRISVVKIYIGVVFKSHGLNGGRKMSLGDVLAVCLPIETLHLTKEGNTTLLEVREGAIKRCGVNGWVKMRPYTFFFSGLSHLSLTR